MLYNPVSFILLSARKSLSYDDDSDSSSSFTESDDSESESSTSEVSSKDIYNIIYLLVIICSLIFKIKLIY